MPLLFRQFADLEAPRFQFRKELQRDPGFQTDNIIQKGGIPRALRPHEKQPEYIKMLIDVFDNDRQRFLRQFPEGFQVIRLCQFHVLIY